MEDQEFRQSVRSREKEAAIKSYKEGSLKSLRDLQWKETIEK